MRQPKPVSWFETISLIRAYAETNVFIYLDIYFVNDNKWFGF